MLFFYPAYSLKISVILTELTLRQCGLHAYETAQLTAVLKDIPSLCMLDLSFNHVGTEAAEHLGNVTVINPGGHKVISCSHVVNYRHNNNVPV